MQGDIKKIENQLNKLCSQHDQLMSLLDIYDYIPNLKHLHQTNRTIATKINNFQHEIEELLETNSTVKIREDMHLKIKQEEFKISIETTQTQLADLNAQVQHQKAVIAELEQGRPSSSKILQLKEKARRKISSMFDELENKIGDELAGQVVKLKQNKINSKNEGEIAIERAIAEQSYNYEKIMHQVELQLLQMEPPLFDEYFQFTYNELKKEILLLNKKAQNLESSQSLQKIGQQRELFEIQITLLKKMSEQLEYRVIAFKRYSGEQLMLRYSQSQDKMKVNDTQKKIRQKLRQLSHLITVLKAAVYLQQDY